MRVDESPIEAGVGGSVVLVGGSARPSLSIVTNRDRLGSGELGGVSARSDIVYQPINTINLINVHTMVFLHYRLG